MPYTYQTGDHYGRGDYYRGDYYRGDPGIFGSLFKVVKGAVGGFIKGGPLGAVVGGATAVAGGAFQRGIARPLPPTGLQQFYPPPFSPGFMPSPFAPPEVPSPVGTLTPQGQFLPGMCNVKGTRPNKSSYFRQVPGSPGTGILIPKGSVCVTTRRLNVANPRALRRSIRRVAGFAKLARRSIRWVSAKPPKGRPVAKRGRR